MKKKVIKIAHLYYDLMNLYGESGNILALEKFIERQGVDTEVYRYTVGDKIDFSSCDFYYMGAGSEENQEIVLNDILKYKEDIDSAINAGKMFLITGNAMELFGRKIRFRDGRVIDTLGIMDFQSCEQDFRLVSEIAYTYDKLEKDRGRLILGYKNCSCNIIHNDERMFGFPNNLNRKNFYAMNFVGPFLVRNPYFTNKLIEDLFEYKGYDYKEITDTIEFKTYHEYIHNFINREDLD